MSGTRKKERVLSVQGRQCNVKWSLGVSEQESKEKAEEKLEKVPLFTALLSSDCHYTHTGGELRWQ